LRTNLLPQLDKGMGTLVKDLVDRGLWQNTVLVWMGEFGRTPRINQNGGRDHWARCWSVVVGGGAIKGGYYGDIQIAGPDRDGHRYRYHMPDLITGAPIPDGVTDKTKRVPGVAIYRTVAKAMRIPDDVLNQFPAVAAAKPLPFLLRT
jgi:uncharacterized protein (DUF1501 family)